MTGDSSSQRGAAARALAPGNARAPGNAGLVGLAATVLALAVRLYLLSRPGYLTGVTEYDDGVYLGGAIDLVSGVLPYHDFAFVQPPGILLAMAPVGLLAKAWTAAGALAAARLLTAAASAGCVALVGSLVRHRGVFVTLVACGTLAVYPDDIMSAHTLLLEPWMNLLVLAGARLAVHRGRLSARRLLAAGLLFGLAGAVKYWAALPTLGLLAGCLAGAGPSGPRRRRAVRFAAGTAAGFALPVAAFAVARPGLFVRSTLLDQASRAGSGVPESLRLAHLTGLADLLTAAGQLTAAAGARSLFARGAVTATATWATGWLPVLLAVVLAALLVLGYARRPAGREPLAWYALGTLAAAVAAVLGYSAFFYHYCDFAAPWLAIAAGYAAGSLAGGAARWPGEPGPRGWRGWRGWRGPVAGGCAVLVLVAGFQAWELSGLRAGDVSAEAALIPPGACVVTDEVSLTVAADRFTAGPFTAGRGGCPAVLDSLAVTLVADNGISVEGGALSSARAVAAWEGIFARARYVWLSSSSGRRVPWTETLRTWFAERFRPVRPGRGAAAYGQLYIRR